MSQLTTVDALRSLSSAQAQHGWQTLVERHGPDVWRLILSRSRDAHEAEDAYQDFWMRLPKAALTFRAGEDVDAERSARAWLMRVAYTTAIDRVRRRRPAMVEAHSGAAMSSTDHTAARLLVDEPTRPGTEDLRDRELLLARVQSAMAELPENYRRPLLLYVVGGLSYEDLAADLRCTVNNARVRVHRSLKRLREVLDGPQETFNERALAGMIVPALLAVPAAPSFALASTAATGGSALLGAGGSTAIGGAKVALGMPVMIGGAALTAGVATTIALAQASASPAVPPLLAVEPIVRMLDDFNRASPHISGHSFTKVPPEISLTPAPSGGSGNALRFGWNTEHAGWIDCEYDDADKTLLSDVIPDARTVITMRVWAPQTTRLLHVGLRLMDKHGEIFEWRQPLPDPGQTGWRTLSFPLDAHNAATWDKRPLADHVADVPLRMFGYAVAMGKMGSPEGVVIIDDVELHQPATTVVASPTP